jgi:hypothetical protein
MGTQQLLLIIVGVVLIGIMVMIGVFMFRDQAAATNRDALSNDLVHFASGAQKYYRRPPMMGGGGSSFDGLTLTNLTSKPRNANGTYQLETDPVSGNPASVKIIGTGIELGNDGTNKVKVVMVVYPDSVSVDNLSGN